MSSSFAPECTELKRKYDNCFNEWYSEKFLKGKSIHNECEEAWTAYEACVHKNLEQQGIKPMLDDARKDAPFEKGGRLEAEDEDEKK